MIEPDPILITLNKAVEEHTAEDIDNIIASLRKHRKQAQSGVKAKKKDTVDLTGILDAIKPKITLVPGKRRF